MAKRELGRSWQLANQNWGDGEREGEGEPKLGNQLAKRELGRSWQLANQNWGDCESEGEGEGEPKIGEISWQNVNWEEVGSWQTKIGKIVKVKVKVNQKLGKSVGKTRIGLKLAVGKPKLGRR